GLFTKPSSMTGEKMPRMQGGRAVVKALKREGVECVFAVPGVQIMDIFDAFHGEKDLRLFTVRHEQSTIYMADGYTRVKGKPGVGLVVPGPGVQNAMAALGTAYACSSPVLLIAGQVTSGDLGEDRGALHEVNDQLDMIRPITKWCRRVTRPEEIPGAIHEAMEQMRTGRPRPTEVEILWDALQKEAEIEFLPGAKDAPAEPDATDIRLAADLLKSAKKPLIWAGGGVILADASAELLALAEALQVPVATTPEGKGAIPEDHPLSLGAWYYAFGPVRYALPEADVILAIGTRMTWQMRPFAALHPPQKLIHVDVDSSVIGKNYPADVAVVADAGAALRALSAEVRNRKPCPARWPLEELNLFREKHQSWLRKRAPLQCRIIDTLRKSLPADAILVSGVTHIGYWCNLAYSVKRPRTYFTSSYFATLGFAFPLALGAKVAAPDRPVVAIVGDGGFMYALPELATAVRYGINLITLVFNDQAFGSTKSEQQVHYQGRVVGTELTNPDFSKLAELFGARGIKANPENLDQALREALPENRPVVIEVAIPTLIPPFQIPPSDVFS
ncbi:MAG: thiamine pyrophosphate-binding protein, partial [Deltaproteobacteria bacterium]|nr:thiamine pyrophosphate-binding protein [Deltaproteobacteria bacterium]